MKTRTVKFPPPVKGESPARRGAISDTANRVVNFDIEFETLVPRLAVGDPVYSGVDVSGACAFGPALFVCDAGTLYRVLSGNVDRLFEVGVGSTLDNVVWNDWLWFITRDGLYRVDTSLMPEKVSFPAPFVSVAGGSGEVVELAVTAVHGTFESAPAMLDAREGASLVVDADYARVYTNVGGVYYHMGNTARGSSIVVQRGSGGICPVIGRNPMPGGTFIAAFGGRLAVSDGPLLYISDPYMPHLFDAAYGTVEFTGSIAFVEALSSDALVVGDYRGVWLLRLGADDRATLKRLVDTPPVWGSAVRVPVSGLFPNTPTDSEGVVFLTKRGWMVVLIDGKVVEVPQDVDTLQARAVVLKDGASWRVVACTGA